MWSDNETNIDLLKTNHLTDAIVNLAKNQSISPLTIGVFGGWGSGKSSLIKIVNDKLDKESDTLCIYFNGWLFEGYEDAKSALLGDILNEITSEKTLTNKSLALAYKLIKRVNWMKIVGKASQYGVAYLSGSPEIQASILSSDLGVVIEKAKDIDPNEIKQKIEGVDFKKLINEKHEDYIDTRKNIREFRADFEELLKETKIKRLVIFIDDLDRCLPNTVIETLEAIKLFLFVPNTVFILTADDKLIEKAVERKFPNLGDGSNEISHDYLEKLIQIPIRIPSLGKNEVYNYMNLLFAQLHLGDKFEELYQKIDFKEKNLVIDYNWIKKNTDECPEELETDLALTQQIGDYLSEMLKGNPRQIKRFLNMLLLRLNIAELMGIKLEKNILAKLMVLEYKNPDAFIELATWQNDQNGYPVEIKYLEQQSKSKVKSKDSEETTKKEKISREAETWSKNLWLKSWIDAEPKLSGVDLRSYFYIAKEKTGIITEAVLQLSEETKDFINNLFSSSDTIHIAAVGQAKSLSLVDALSVFEVIKNKIKRSEDLKGGTSEINILLAFVEVRDELIDKTLILLNGIAETRLGAGLPPKLKILEGKNGESDILIKELLTKWSKSGVNLTLAAAALNMLNRK